jgi:hypothetical protein
MDLCRWSAHRLGHGDVRGDLMDGVSWWEMLLAIFFVVVLPLAVIIGSVCVLVLTFTSLWRRRR